VKTWKKRHKTGTEWQDELPYRQPGRRDASFAIFQQIFSEDDMRALVFFLFVLGAVAFMASCGSEVTEVAWKNVDSSNVNDIIWERDGIHWINGDAGFATNAVTDAKEITSVSSDVTCAVEISGDFVRTNNVRIDGKEGAVSVSEGSSHVLSLSTY